MTALVVSALRARWGNAVMTFVLAMLAAAFAAAGPTYESAALQAVRDAEIAAAPVDQLVVRAIRTAPHRDIEPPPPLPSVPGMRTVHGRFLAGDIGAERLTALTTRKGACEHLAMLSGRCAMAGNEVVARQDMGLKVGQDIEFSYLVEKVAHSLRLTVVGTYAYLDVRDPFWGKHDELIGLGFTGPLITTEQTMPQLTGPLLERVDVIAGRDAFTGDTQSELDDVTAVLATGNYQISSEILQLSGRLDHSRGLLRDKLVMAVVPLVLTCWFVLFLAVAGAIRQRRDELGLAALRGVPTGLRWLLPSLETGVPVLLGAFPGYLLGFLAVAAFTGAAEMTPAAMWASALAVGGAVLAGTVAQLAALSSPVHSLLQRVARRGRPAWRAALELMVATLAVAVAYQAVVEGGEAKGLSTLTPLLLALGAGIVAARLTARPAESLGREVLRRGRVNLGLSLLALARRPGNGPVTILLTVVIGLLDFAAVSAVSLRGAWEQRAVVETAAPRVLSVAPVPATQLLNAVRAADPGGTQAMAAARLDAVDETPILAVDSPRLAAVALWPADYGAMPARDVAKLLRPQPPTPIMVHGELFKLRLGLELADPNAAVRITLRLIDSGGREVLSPSPDLSVGTHEYVLKTTTCAASPCRLDSIEIVMVAQSGTKAQLTLAGEGHRWVGTGVRLEPAGVGLLVRLEAAGRVEMRLFPVVVPDPLPMAGSVPPPAELPGVSNTLQYKVLDAGRLDAVPRLGERGLLMDLEYASLGPGDTPRAGGEVWLAPGASAEVVERLRANGLTILDDRTAAGARDLLQRQAPAMTLRFLIVAAAACLLVGAAGLLVMAALERGRPEEGLQVLRAQGLEGRTVAAAALGARVVMLGIAVVAGLAAGTASWLLARQVLPPYLDDSWRAPAVPLHALPSLAVPVAIGTAVLAAACWLAARVSNKEGGLS